MRIGTGAVEGAGTGSALYSGQVQEIALVCGGRLFEMEEWAKCVCTASYFSRAG